MITKKAYKTFLAGALVSGLITFLAMVIAPDLTFNISIMEQEFQSSYVYAWLLFTIYLLILSVLYFTATRWKLVTKKWMVISHYTFSILLLIFFLAFSVFDTPQFQMLTTRLQIPLTTVVSIYAFLLLADMALFFASILMLIVNMFFLHKSEGGKS